MIQKNEMQTKVVDYDNGIYGIDQQMVRSFLIVGEKRGLLIDTGAMETDFISVLASITNLPIDLCLSHSDFDHIANIGYFQQLYVHKEEAPVLKARYDFSNQQIIEIDEGHIFELGNRRIEVIHLPGHTPGSIGFLDRKNKILFSGDTISCGPVYMFGEYRNQSVYRNTLLKLKKMADEQVFQVIYPCHYICPIDVDMIEQLIACADGIADDSIPAEPAQLMFRADPMPQLYRYKDAEIFYCK